MMPRKKQAPKAGARPEATPPVSTTAARAVPVGGRVTLDRPDTFFGMNVAAILPPPNALGDWRALDLDARTLDSISPIKLAEYLVDISPDVSRALFDFLREC